MGNTCNCIDSKKDKAEVNISSIQNDVEDNNNHLYESHNVEVHARNAPVNGQNPKGSAAMPAEYSEVSFPLIIVERTKYILGQHASRKPICGGNHHERSISERIEIS